MHRLAKESFAFINIAVQNRFDDYFLSDDLIDFILVATYDAGNASPYRS
ncbi:hypothetical protein SDC9_121858 [bioreactor metagenome]|uniref:Uncharacterized protein n=1 Tax=bioreactor metagenome TaxID=1076179 RepID=A0A645CD41_9ZZZZ